MGRIDAEGREYLSDKKIFSDAFNFLLYGGRQVIKPEELKELDTAQIAIPYGNNARVPTQKYRDLFRLWSAMTDDNAVYLMLGAELQAKQHMAAPVKNGLYDMIGYARQVEEAGRSYRKKGDEKEGDLYVEDGALKIRLTSEEFLSGFRKEDKLIPIITVIVYLDPGPWEGPRCLHDMFDVKDKEILKFVPDYPINLIEPAAIGDNEFGRFHTDLGLTMKVLKYRNDKADKVIEETNHRKIDRGTAVFLNRVADLKLEFDEKEAEVDMCLAMENRMKKEKVEGAIQAFRIAGLSESEIITKVVENFNVTKEYVLALLSPKAV